MVDFSDSGSRGPSYDDTDESSAQGLPERLSWCSIADSITVDETCGKCGLVIKVESNHCWNTRSYGGILIYSIGCCWIGVYLGRGRWDLSNHSWNSKPARRDVAFLLFKKIYAFSSWERLLHRVMAESWYLSSLIMCAFSWYMRVRWSMCGLQEEATKGGRRWKLWIP